MACLKLTLTPQAPAAMTVAATPGAKVDVVAGGAAALEVEASAQAELGIAAEELVLGVTPPEGAQLLLGEVCSISGGTLVVLAGSDGPFRTKGGGYFLLDPSKNPPEE